MDIITRYNDLRESGMSEAAACKALVKEGVDFDDAVNAAWEAAGKTEPHKDDCQAVSTWNRGWERRNNF